MKRKTGKRAAMIPGWVVIILILIMSAAAIFIFLRSISDARGARIKACHQQILYRHTFNIGGVEIGRKSIPLSACKAGHLCFVSSNKEECEELKGLANIEKVKVENEEQVVELIANRMADCWSMVGEGYLNYQPRGWGWESSYCGICDKIAFSKEAGEKIRKINYGEFYDYLESTKISGLDQTFSKYLYNLDSMDAVEELMLTEARSESGEEKDISDVIMVDTSYGYAIIVGLTREGLIKKMFSMKIAGVVSFIVNSVSKGRDVEQIPPQLVIYDLKNREAIDKLGCDSFDFLP